jgi:hypothetical protein
VNAILEYPHYGRYNGFLTVLRATEKEEGTDGGVRGLRGALFWISSASLAILRREEEEVSGPKDIEWKDNGFLQAKSTMYSCRKKVTHPSRTAERQRSWMAVSDTEHSPSERKIMTGVLSR